jgi:hypothetical protein
MKYAVQVRCAVWSTSLWEVEAPDEEAARQRITDAFAEGSDFEESAGCRRTELDYEVSEPFEEIEKINEIKKAEA